MELVDFPLSVAVFLGSALAGFLCKLCHEDMSKEAGWDMTHLSEIACSLSECWAVVLAAKDGCYFLSGAPFTA